MTPDTASPFAGLVDTHCHLDMLAAKEPIDDVLARARAAGVTGVVTIGIDLASSRAAVHLAESFPGVWATVGIHPHDAGQADEEALAQLADLARHPRVVGYGEIGMDLAKRYTPEEVQRRAFRLQLELAVELELPVVIHDRDAHDQVLAELERVAPLPAGGIMHCFSGDAALARRVVELGLVLSIPGVVTFANGATLQEVVRRIPLEAMVLETDAPFLAPVPKRGRRNEPAYLVHTARKVAELQGVDLETVMGKTTATARRVFQLHREDHHGPR